MGATVDKDYYILDQNKLVIDIKYRTGDAYKGEIVNGKANGRGIYYYSNGNRYEGQFANNRFCGYGILYCINGDSYQGRFVDDKFHGSGFYRYANGSSYDGEYANGKRNGQGLVKIVNKYKDLIYTYDGQWVDDQKCGQGLEIINRVDGSKEVCRGSWYNDKRHGYCQVIVNDQIFYTGYFINDVSQQNQL